MCIYAILGLSALSQFIHCVKVVIKAPAPLKVFCV